MSPVTFNNYILLSSNHLFVSSEVRFQWLAGRLAGTDRRVFLLELEAEQCVQVEARGSARDDGRCCQSIFQALVTPGVVPNEAQAGVLIFPL